MPRSTDDLIEDFIDQGFTPDEARDMAEAFIVIHRDIREGELDLADIEFLADLIDEDTEEFKKIFKIGCCFNGIKEIAKYEDQSIYIPSSYYCAVKCFEKYLGGEIDKKGLNPYGDSLRKIRKKLVQEEIDLESCPSVFKKDGDKFVTIHKDSNNKAGACILLYRIKKCYYHAALINSNKITMEDYDRVIQNTRFVTNKELSIDQVKLQLPKLKEADNSYYVYDAETSSKITDDKRFQIPEGLGFMKLI